MVVVQSKVSANHACCSWPAVFVGGGIAILNEKLQNSGLYFRKVEILFPAADRKKSCKSSATVSSSSLLSPF